ncbi:MAG: hypothetical protein ACE3L7_28880 [Candidatus Pristimantibacillus sp.]
MHFRKLHTLKATRDLYPIDLVISKAYGLPLMGQTYPESSAHRQSLGAIQLAAQRSNSDKVYHT